jgi:hypothetical protein
MKLQDWLSVLLNGLQPLIAKYVTPMSLSEVLNVL